MRIKSGKNTRRKHNKVLKQAKGFRGGSGRLYRNARGAVDRALQYAYRDRRVKKRDMRSLWIQRINAAARLNGTTYSKLIFGLQSQGILVDRKILAELAVGDPNGFANLAEIAKSA